MRNFFVSTLAILLGVAWTVAPAIATSHDKAEKAETKSEGTKETMKEKVGAAKDKVKEKTESAMDKVKEKTGAAMAKAKAKTREAKEKVTETKDKVAAKMDRAQVRNAQQALKSEGHDPGPIDGVMGPRTTAAVRAYQKAAGLQETGQLDQATMNRLGARGSASPGTSSEPARGPQRP